jgi:rare lipoprotein A
MQLRSLLLLAPTLFLLSGCAHKRRHVSPPPPPAIGHTETGLASWYGYPYHGRHAADGEIYDMEKLTAAHKTFAFNTWVRVENVSNQKVVDVRITDRGPFVKGRIIDLSKAAARNIDLLGPGVGKVRLVVIRAPEKAEGVGFAVQVGAFADAANAEAMRARMEKAYGEARIVKREGTPPVQRVLAGREATEEAAHALEARIVRETGEKSAFVVRLDF